MCASACPWPWGTARGEASGGSTCEPVCGGEPRCGDSAPAGDAASKGLRLCPLPRWAAAADWLLLLVRMEKVSDAAACSCS